MERVTGIGGFYFRARDPKALATWYEQRLGVATAPRSYEAGAWRRREGETVFVGQLRADGEVVEVDPQRYRTDASMIAPVDLGVSDAANSTDAASICDELGTNAGLYS